MLVGFAGEMHAGEQWGKHPCAGNCLLFQPIYLEIR